VGHTLECAIRNAQIHDAGLAAGAVPPTAPERIIGELKAG